VTIAVTLIVIEFCTTSTDSECDYSLRDPDCSMNIAYFYSNIYFIIQCRNIAIVIVHVTTQR